MKFQKPALTFSEQVDLLISRGLIVSGHSKAEACLENINYYRFSAYCLPFENPRHHFIAGTTFEQVCEVYEFDRELRLLVIDALERIETTIGTDIAYQLAHAHNPFAHTEQTIFRPTFNHSLWTQEVQKETLRSKEVFIDHYKKTYDGFPVIPIWMLVEILSFGNVSKLYEGMKKEDQWAISRPYGIHPSCLWSWLRTLVYVRNICAHHSRLWNRELAIAPYIPSDDFRWTKPIPVDPKFLFSTLLILWKLQAKHAKWNGQIQTWKMKVNDLLARSLSVSNKLQRMGVPANWAQHPLWQ